MKKIICAAVALSALLLGASCTGGKNSLRAYKGSYLESVRLNFEAGERALAAKEYEKAIGYFQFVKTKYPFSKYASLSDLKIADAKFSQEKWLDAASAYEIFIRLHPRHEEVAYASFRVGASYFKAVPDGFFLTPPPTSRDQTFTKEAMTALERFILQYPRSKHIAEATAMRLSLFSFLAKHNMHIADYYQRRGKHEAAVNRLLEVQELYPQTKESGEALYLAAIIFNKYLNNKEKTFEILSIIIDQKPDSAYVQKSKEMLDEILQEEQPASQ